ncbi:MAG: hypothetical protein FWG83_02835 [Oscillospiraceae bacterium]|nr:hypothetical protein [Oscillospiraceae bacterium]
MPRVRAKTTPAETDYLTLWKNEYKPLILSHFQVPLNVVAEVMGISVNTVQEQLRSGLYDYGIARPCPGGCYRYEVMPLRLIAYVEGTMSRVSFVSYGV